MQKEGGISMYADTQVSIAEATRDFSRVVQIADENGSVVILQDDVPRYLLVPVQKNQGWKTIPDDLLMDMSDRLIERNREAYEALAK